MAHWFNQCTVCMWRVSKVIVLIKATETTQAKIEEAFKSFTRRDDIAIIMITQKVCAQLLHCHVHTQPPLLYPRA